MTAQIINGKQVSEKCIARVAEQVAQRKAAGLRVPGLAVVLVGDDPASAVYVRNKQAACEKAALKSFSHILPAATGEAELLDLIDRLNADPEVDGILVQLPLPKHINSQSVLERIHPQKDVDGFHIASAGALMTGQPGFRPCTPYGCMKMLQSIGMNDLRGKNAVVIGRSNIVGKPMALMLLAANATVTVCHSGTASLAAFTRQADVIVAAAGQRKVLTADMVKPGAVVIDVGMNRDENGKLCGDVDFEGVRQVASWITPVPGGVGPMTRAMLLVNTIEAAENASQSASR